MILPTISAISRDALDRRADQAARRRLWPGSDPLGSDSGRHSFPPRTTGILGAVLLAFGRALGETMALAMLVGNANVISLSLFSPGNTLAALLANNFPEAGPKQVGVLMYAALVLMAITLLVNVLGAWILQRAARDFRGAR